MGEGRMENRSPIKIAAKWLQPGVVMGIAARVMCFAVLQGTPAIVAPSIQDTAFNASGMWDRVQDSAIHIGSQAVEAYENVRFVYHVAQRLREIEREPASAELQTKIVRFRQHSGDKELILAQHERRIESCVRAANVVPQKL
jgi:hypothetical protein